VTIFEKEEEWKMKIDEMLKHIRDEHHDGQELSDPINTDYPGEHENFDEGTALQQFRDCFKEDMG
jgi:hypothetical protein